MRITNGFFVSGVVIFRLNVDYIGIFYGRGFCYIGAMKWKRVERLVFSISSEMEIFWWHG